MRRTIGQCVAMMLVVAVCQVAAANEFNTLPAAVAEGESLASFAAGAVEFTYPNELRASEAPRGRQVLLVLSRDDPPQSPGALRDGFWVTYRSKRGQQESMADLLARGLQADYRRIELGASHAVRLAGGDGLRQEFTLAQQGALFGPPGKTATTGPQAHRGWRQLIETESGVVEIHFIAPQGAFLVRQRELDGVLASLQLGPPRSTPSEVDPQLLDAEPIVGTWKSARGLMEIGGDGAMTLTYDRPQTHQLDRLGFVDLERRVRKLVGKFQADGDLLRIRWSDGSLLNMRWRLAAGELLITDHQGRTSRLSRVYR